MLAPTTSQNAEIPMKRLFFNAATICMVALAVLMTQAAFNATANAQKQAGTSPGGNILQRVADLEERQEENDKEFVLIDQSLGDLDARVNANDGRLIVHSAKIRALEASVKAADKRLSIQRADHRKLVAKVAEIRARHWIK